MVATDQQITSRLAALVDATPRRLTLAQTLTLSSLAAKARDAAPTVAATKYPLT